MVNQRSAVAEAEAIVAKADAEVAALAARFASERNAAVGAAASSQQQPPASTASAEDFVSVTYANEKWAEREAEYARIIAHMQALVDEGAGTAAPSEAAPSDVGDLASLEGLEDDAAWGRIEKSKRKAVIRHQRDRLAKEVKSSLGGFAKVSAATSPFKKKT